MRGSWGGAREKKRRGCEKASERKAKEAKRQVAAEAEVLRTPEVHPPFAEYTLGQKVMVATEGGTWDCGNVWQAGARSIKVVFPTTGLSQTVLNPASVFPAEDSGRCVDATPSSTASERRTTMDANHSTPLRATKAVEVAVAGVTEDEIPISPDISCTACGSPEDDDQMLICDECNQGYHLWCLDPPLKAIPEGDWFCPVRIYLHFLHLIGPP